MFLKACEMWLEREDGGGRGNTFRKDLIGNPQLRLRRCFLPPILSILSLQERIPGVGQMNASSPGPSAPSLRSGRLGLQGAAAPSVEAGGAPGLGGGSTHVRES